MQTKICFQTIGIMQTYWLSSFLGGTASSDSSSLSDAVKVSSRKE
jgi:hypothetical protein